MAAGEQTPLPLATGTGMLQPMASNAPTAEVVMRGVAALDPFVLAYGPPVNSEHLEPMRRMVEEAHVAIALTPDPVGIACGF